MSENSLQTSFWVMVFVQTIGSVDMPGRGPRKMPAPRQYIAILLTWLVLQLIASIGAAAARATAAIGWALVLTGLVVGPFGKQVTNLFAVVANQFGVASLQAAQNTPMSQAEIAAGISPGGAASPH